MVTAEILRFQSPSLRGSGRFARAPTLRRPAPRRFNPLHCGAVVASRIRGAGGRTSRRVSIPFIAGQWSLHGAPQPGVPAGNGVSIPFIAGQWSLPLVARLRNVLENERFNPLHCGAVVASVSDMQTDRPPPLFQSPSLRGSGRFTSPIRSSWMSSTRFNPLHCGAVVASGRRRPRLLVLASCFNPLHCGAVVASPWQVTRPCTALRSFNPLHCGAVVASPDGARARRMRARVSIPFIAGQWSLRSDGSRLVRVHPGVSIPFIAGQWSLLKKNNREPRAPD